MATTRRRWTIPVPDRCHSRCLGTSTPRPRTTATRTALHGIRARSTRTSSGNGLGTPHTTPTSRSRAHEAPRAPLARCRGRRCAPPSCNGKGWCGPRWPRTCRRVAHRAHWSRRWPVGGGRGEGGTQRATPRPLRCSRPPGTIGTRRRAAELCTPLPCPDGSSRVRGS
jgi:hypothetical protein